MTGLHRDQVLNDVLYRGMDNKMAVSTAMLISAVMNYNHPQNDILSLQ
ncbi:MAG: hypothetical protein K6F23_03330 [Solobacterium sp.]|nr:hypothetical protein [Solobacterium sp.]